MRLRGLGSRTERVVGPSSPSALNIILNKSQVVSCLSLQVQGLKTLIYYNGENEGCCLVICSNAVTASIYSLCEHLSVAELLVPPGGEMFVVFGRMKAVCLGPEHEGLLSTAVLHLFFPDLEGEIQGRTGKEVSRKSKEFF